MSFAKYILKYLLFFLQIFPILLFAQSNFNPALESFKADNDLLHGSLGFCAVDIQKNTIFSSYNAEQSLIPASSLKVITTGTALAILGPKHTFYTYLEYSGKIQNGQLEGDLYIRGTGDPSLASPLMDGVPSRDELMNSFKDAIIRTGIKSIKGNIIADLSYFDDQHIVDTWQWGDIGNHYGAATYGLNYHDNLYYIRFNKKPNFGDLTEILETEPEIKRLKIDNRVTAAGKNSGDNAYVYSNPFSYDVVIRGTIPRGSGTFGIKAASPDPALMCAIDLKNSLKKQNISVQGQCKTSLNYKMSNNREVIYTHRSPQLSAIIKHTNEKSRNLYCEALLKVIGIKTSNNPSTQAGIDAIIQFWTDRGIDMSGCFLQDGSGLSARNGIPTKVFAQILRKMYLDTSSFPGFYDLLAIAGQTGTLKYFCKGSAADNNMRAKSGSLNRVRSFSGYLTNKSGRLLSFSVIVNNYKGKAYLMKKKLEKLLIALAES